MKEIKVNIIGYEMTKDNSFIRFTIRPKEPILNFDFTKKYKLVEDEPTDLPGFKGGKFPKGVLFETDDTKVEEWIKANQNAFKFTPQFTFIYGGRSGGKTATQTELYKQFLDQLKTVNDLQESVTIKRVMFNGNATILEIGDFKTVVKCHEGDKFSYVIGLGLALMRYHKKQPSTKKDIKFLERCCEYENLAEYCFEKYFNFDEKRIWNFLKNCNKGKWIEL